VLEQIAWDHDARFTAVKVFAVDALGDVPGTDASAALLKMVRAQTGPAGIPPAAQKRAGDELVERKDASAGPLFLDALKVHEDFLADTHATGVDVLARAVAALRLKDAAPLLAAHLGDPATPATALKEIVAALTALGGGEASRALKEFLVTYRADPAFFGDPSPLTIAAEGLLGGSAEDRRTVEFVAADKRTLAPVARYLQKAVEDAHKKQAAR
jgi:hypothetical protein